MTLEHPDSLSSTSPSLLSRARHADPQAWSRLTQLYGPVVYQWARRAGLQPQDAADVMQDVFQAVTQHIERFDGQLQGNGFRGWLWTIARNKIRDHFRRLKGKAQAAGGTSALLHLHELPENPPEETSQSGAEELRGIRRRALELVRNDFEDQTWIAFWRATVESDTPADIAADLGVSVWTVYKARSRVLARLREELDGLGGS